MTAADRLTRPYRHLPTSASIVGSLALVGAFLAGCGGDSDDVPIVPVSDSGTEVEKSPPALTAPTAGPDKDEKLRIAEKAKEREKKDPNHFTACLNSDGTLQGEVEHARAADAPPLTKEDKKVVCEKQSRFDDPADNPASPDRGGAS